MTLERRRRRNSDIFDTGAFGNYRSLGNGEDENGTPQADLSSVSAVVWSYENNLISYSVAYNTLMIDFGMSDNDISDILTYEADDLVEEYESERLQQVGDNYNPQVPTSNYETGEYIVPNVGQATMHNVPIPTNTRYKYWDGELATHTWNDHGCSTSYVTGKDATNGEPGGMYPKPIVDAYGGYAVSMSHYMASYGSDGSFLGFRVLTPSELDGGIPAGIPIATVMQFFTKCAKSRRRNILGAFRDNDFTNNGANFVLDTEVNPIWRKAIDMQLAPKSFFLAEKEIATVNKISPNNGGVDGIIVQQQTHFFSPGDFEHVSNKGYNDVPTVFAKNQFHGNKPRADVLDRQFRVERWIGTKGKTKESYAAKVEWLGENGQFGSYSTHPNSIPKCDEQGKTMVIYRFPRQLDSELDKELLRFYAQNNMPNYDITSTGSCYPMPDVRSNGTISDGDKFGLIGRLIPEGSDDLFDTEKFETEYNGKKFAGRRKIDFIPMISPTLPPSDRHRPYRINMTRPEGIDVNDPRLFTDTDWFCFDTSVVSGARISVTDPYKKALLGSSRLTNAYFPQADLDVGSSAFAIGQCMLAYDLSKPSVDSKMGENYVNLPHSSERIILTTETMRMDSVQMRREYGDAFTSDELTPRPTRDGSAAGSYKSDYLPPVQIITTDDLILMENPPAGYIEPVGMAAVREAWKKTFGTELSSAAFAALPDIGSNDNPNRYGRRDPNNPLRYTISTEYGSFSYPFSIAIFNIPSHFRGPVLKYTDEVNAQGNLIPMAPTADKPGYIGTRPVRMVYQTPFGEVNSSVINLDRQVQRQIDVIEEGGTVEDIFEQQTQEGGVDEGQFTEDEQEIFTERQFENWIYERLMEDYGNARFTDAVSKAYFKWWNKDYVTGKMLLEAGFPIPGVDLAPYYAEAERSGIPIASQVTPTEEQDQQSAAISGFGAFTDSSGFTVTDVTAKWGALGSANPRYTGDVGMSMVPYKANIQDEQLGYLAMSNLDGVENMSNVSGLGGPLDDVSEGVGDGFRYFGALGGSGLAIAGIGIAGSALMFATVSSIQAIKIRKIAEEKAKGL